MMKAGLGFSAVRIGDVKVGAIAAVNAVGDVYDPDTGELIAGLLSEDGNALVGMADEIYASVEFGRDALSGDSAQSGGVSYSVAAAEANVRVSGDGSAGLIARAGGGGVQQNTTLVCVVTNAVMTKPQANRMATIAHDGIARSVRPAHTSADGDAVFAMASCAVRADADAVSCIAADMTAAAIQRAALAAAPAYGLQSARSFL
jgi:L-aminopeptidase/D-esterase-like protein